MNFTDDEIDALHKEFLQNSGEDILYGNHRTFKKISLSELKFSDNRDVFDTLIDFIEKKSFITLEYGIEEKCPFYKLSTSSIKRKLYLNKEILNYLYNYLENNILGESLPSNYNGAQNANENYILHLLKRDRKNRKMFCNSETGYKADYNRITIVYGHLPYTLEELNTKLDSL